MLSQLERAVILCDGGELPVCFPRMAAPLGLAGAKMAGEATEQVSGVLKITVYGQMIPHLR